MIIFVYGIICQAFLINIYQYLSNLEIKNNKRLSQNDNTNKLDHIYLVEFEKQCGVVCERDYSSKL